MNRRRQAGQNGLIRPRAGAAGPVRADWAIRLIVWSDAALISRNSRRAITAAAPQHRHRIHSETSWQPVWAPAEMAFASLLLNSLAKSGVIFKGRATEQTLARWELRHRTLPDASQTLLSSGTASDT